jgi:type II secretory pathway pseudopilin PulG
MDKNQKGFAVLETLLILVIIAMIAGTGWYTWHTKNQTDKILNEASNSAQTVQTNKTTNSSSAKAQQYFTIKEWGVRAPYTGTLDLQYSLSDSNTLASVTSKQLLAADPACTRGGAILRALPNDPVGPAGDPASTVAQSGATYAYVGGYYYIFTHDQAACSDSDTATTLQSQNNDAVQALVPNLQAIPQ